MSSLDVLIVGAGFSGLYLLHKLRKLGFHTKICEAGSDIGGVWYWNRYPGARVDCDFSFYQLTTDDIWEDFEWTERFPAQEELEKYFKHVDNKLNLSKDIKFNARVTSADFESSSNQWLVKIRDGESIRARFLILCTGYAERRYVPALEGLNSFMGTSIHTSLWPKSGLNVVGKRVAVIGTGASGVQVIQEIASKVDHLTVYQRTPNLALPMQQSSLKDQTKWTFPTTEMVPQIFQRLRTKFTGMDIDYVERNGVDDTPEERQAVFEELYKKGGFHFWIGSYKDIIITKETNDAVYRFWCESSRARINDPVKKDILAPLIPPHPFGAKRPSLEQRYFEVYNQANVDVINLRESPIIEITREGVKTEKEGVTEVDTIIFATGFDACTGGILNIQITNENNETLQKTWEKGVWTNLGISTAGFPNMFFTNGPQAPTAFANGPTCAEVQADWIINLLVNMRKEKLKRVATLVEAQIQWKGMTTAIWNLTLFPLADSWYQGANVPGKPQEPLNFVGGIPLYISLLDDCARNNYKGYSLS